MSKDDVADIAAHLTWAKTRLAESTTRPESAVQEYEEASARYGRRLGMRAGYHVGQRVTLPVHDGEDKRLTHWSIQDMTADTFSGELTLRLVLEEFIETKGDDENEDKVKLDTMIYLAAISVDGLPCNVNDISQVPSGD